MRFNMANMTVERLADLINYTGGTAACAVHRGIKSLGMVRARVTAFGVAVLG